MHNSFIFERMKRSLFLCFLVTLMAVQPMAKLFICINFGINRNFIANNLCEKKTIKNNKCKGKCHLRKQLKATDTDAKNEKSNEAFNVLKFTQETLVNSTDLFLADLQDKFNFINTVYLANLMCLPNPPDSKPPEVIIV